MAKRDEEKYKDEITEVLENYIKYLQNNPQEIKKINTEVKQLWDYLGEIEEKIYTYNPKWDLPFTI